MVKVILKCFYFIFILSFLCASNNALGQELSSNFDGKELLEKRIECYSTALQSRKWPDVYDFLSKDFIEGRSRDAFTQQMNEGVNEDKFIDFYPKNYVTLSDNDKNEQLFVTGCIKLLVGESVRVYSGSLEAIRDSGQWYFSSLPIVNPNRMNGGPNKCDLE